MKALLLLSCAWLAVLADVAAAQGQEKTPTGKGIDAATVAAYKRLGGHYGGWLRDAFGSLSFQHGRTAAENGLPGFHFGGSPRGKLPVVTVPFGLDFRRANLMNRDFRRLELPPKLVLLDLSSNSLSDEVLLSLASLKNLTWLSLGSTQVTNAGLKDLAGITNLSTLALPTNDYSDPPGLKALLPLKKLTALSALKVTDKGLQELASWQKLTALQVGGTSAEPSPKGLKELTALKNLTALDLSFGYLTDAKLKELSAFTNLTSLKLNSNHQCTDEGLKALLPLKKLTALDLSNTAVTDKGLKELAGLTHLTTLLLGDKVTGKGLKELAPLKNLTTLTLDGALTDDALLSLRAIGLLHALNLAKGKTDARPKSPAEVISLDMPYRVTVTDEGLKALAPLQNLTALDLSRAKVTDADLKELAVLPKLATLSLDETKVTDAGLQHLTTLKNLTSLSLRNTKVTDAGLKTLASLKNLTALNLLETPTTLQGLKALAPLNHGVALSWYAAPVTDETLRTLRTLGLLHALVLATGKDGTRPKSQADVVGFDFDLGRPASRLQFPGGPTLVTNEGLKELAPLKNLTALVMNERMMLKGLKELPGLRNLTALHITDGWSLREEKNTEEKVPNAPKDQKEKVPPSVFRELAVFKNLHSLELPQVSDYALCSLRELGLLHVLNRAQDKDGARPKSATDVVAMDLSGTQVTGAGLKELAPLKNLQFLNLKGNLVRWESLKELAPFKHLVVVEYGMSNDIFRTLRAASLLHTLPWARAKDGSRPQTAAAVWSLDLHWRQAVSAERLEQVTGAGLKDLATLENLAELDLQAMPVTDKDLKEVAAFKNLHTLNLLNTKITDEGPKALAPLQKLTTLYLPLKDTSLRILREIGLLHAISQARGKDSLRPRSAAEVVSLNLAPSHFDSRLLRGLKEFTSFPNLTTLRLRGMLVTKESFKTLASFQHLAALDLNSTGGTNGDLNDLAGLKNLTELDLGAAEVSDKGVKELAALNNLRALNLMYARISEKGLAALRQALPKCAIIR